MRPVVSFAPSDGVLRAVAVVEQGAAREADVLAFAEDLDASSAVDRFRIAADGASTGALLVDGGRGGEALRVVRLDDGVAPDDDASTASSEASEVDAGDWRREAPRSLFVLGTKLDAASLREGLRACLVPEASLRPASRTLGFVHDDPLAPFAGAPEARGPFHDLDGTSRPTAARLPFAATTLGVPGAVHCSTASSARDNALSVAPLPSLHHFRFRQPFFLLRFCPSQVS